jgi:hypothetical protein
MRNLYALARCQLWAGIAWWSGYEASSIAWAAGVQLWAAHSFERCAGDASDPRSRLELERKAARARRRSEYFTGQAERLAELHGAALMLRAAAEAERR